ncbi:MAG: T9SS type A sorting domain-containing protein, partial [Bacteroidia bacterium]|nr:T9SS type A sorting domain-containing protein [Bacteroidia bacterium]
DVEINVENLALPIGSKLYVRLKSTNGTWSAPKSITRKEFLSNSGSIIEYGEYYINSDPGKGKGIPLNLVNGIADIPINQQNKGDIIYVRIKDNFDRWSPAKVYSFNYQQVVKAEYVIKSKSGSMSSPQIMTLSSDINLPWIYNAEAENIPLSNVDSVFVRYQGENKIYSQWFKRSLNPIDGIDSFEENSSILTCFPNPFSNATTIRLGLTELSFVNLRVIGQLGQIVETLINKELPGGQYALPFDGTNLPAGVYYCQLITNKKNATIKLSLQR